ncbi:acetyltransferase [Pseudomonas sp. PS1]|uniref:Acetyltransferase n=1 Tax=Stutzerimonas marianensis TaxID=2929513 RepID=A0A9X2ATV9_9GAMM|nr:acetyltransferase [Pseudomonas marianensis]MCJ0972456.1 acetyltransferase [Pseudomonas marianensis]
MMANAYAELPLVMLGAGGHAKVLLSLIRAAEMNVVGVCDPVLAENGIRKWRGLIVLGADEALDAINPASVGLVNGIGQLAASTARRRVFERFKEKGFSFPVLVHPTAWVDESTVLSEGVQVMAGAVIQADVTVGLNSIINTSASIDHDCYLGSHIHVAPGATVCGHVNLSDFVFIATGATVIQAIHIGESAIVGAGATVVRNLGPGETLLGAAARNISQT